MKIPLLDIQAQHDSMRAELDDAIARVLAHGRFVGGPEVDEFEESFASYCVAAECVGVASGTDAVTLALRAAGIGPGDEVITTTLTFMATVESIVETGADPVLVDPDADTALLHAEQVEAAITKRTAALVPVHLYGQPVDMQAFGALADRHGLLLVEDAAQAHGAEWNGRRVGSQGRLAAFSFFPGKNLGALGDAGAIVTGDAALAARLRSLRDHGRGDKYRHDELGVNARLDTLQAAVLSAKLKHLDTWNAARRAHAAAYDERLAGIDTIEPIRQEPHARSVYHQYVVRAPDRDRALAALAGAGIAAGVHYPIPLHRQPALVGRVGEQAFPNAERLAGEVLSLPAYPELPEDALDRVVATLAEHGARSLAENRSGAV